MKHFNSPLAILLSKKVFIFHVINSFCLSCKNSITRFTHASMRIIKRSLLFLFPEKSSRKYSSALRTFFVSSIREVGFMSLCMKGLGVQKLKVFNRIVCFVSVFVMNNLGRFQSSAQRLFDLMSMFICFSSINVNSYITMVKASCPISRNNSLERVFVPLPSPVMNITPPPCHNYPRAIADRTYIHGNSINIVDYKSINLFPKFT